MADHWSQRRVGLLTPLAPAFAFLKRCTSPVGCFKPDTNHFPFQAFSSGNSPLSNDQKELVESDHNVSKISNITLVILTLMRETKEWVSCVGWFRKLRSRALRVPLKDSKAEACSIYTSYQQQSYYWQKSPPPHLTDIIYLPKLLTTSFQALKNYWLTILFYYPVNQPH